MIKKTNLFAMLLCCAFNAQYAAEEAPAPASETAATITEKNLKKAGDCPDILNLDVFVVPTHIITVGVFRDCFSTSIIDKIETLFGQQHENVQCVETGFIDPFQSNQDQLQNHGSDPRFPDSDKLLPSYMPRSYLPDEGQSISFTCAGRVVKITGSNLKYKYAKWGTMQAAIAKLKVVTHSPSDSSSNQNAGSDSGDQKSNVTAGSTSS